jgi:hypothetical protein
VPKPTVLAQPHSSFSFRPNFLVLIQRREFLDRISSSFSSITLEVGTQATGEKMPGEPLELALQENPLWHNPPGISSPSRILPLPPTPSLRGPFFDAPAIEKGVPIVSCRAAPSKSTAQTLVALPN